MTIRDTNGGVGEEDNGLIRSLRSDIDKLTAELKSVQETTATEVRREYQAKDLLGDQFSQLAPYLIQEVDGDLTPEVAEQWLAAKGLKTAAPDTVMEEAPANDAEAVAELGNLGGAAAAVSTSSNEPGIHDKLSNVKGEFEGRLHPSNMPEFTSRIAQALDQG